MGAGRAGIGDVVNFRGPLEMEIRGVLGDAVCLVGHFRGKGSGKHLPPFS